MTRDWKEVVLAEIREELEAMEAAGREPKSVSELEAMTLAMSQRAGKRTFESWMEARAKEALFSP